jgi:hypothetical protein
MEDRKKILVELSLEFGPHQYIYSMMGKSTSETDLDIRINLFFGKGRFFTFYSGLFKKRRLKKNTWLLELIYHRDKHRKNSDDRYVIKPLKILEGVTRENGRYKYKKVWVSAYLMRQLLEGSTNPEAIDYAS